MKPNYKVEHSLVFDRPNFIEVINYKALNKVKNYSWMDKDLSILDNSIGVWKIKYKN